MLRRQRLLGRDQRRHRDRLGVEGAAMQHAIGEEVEQVGPARDCCNREAVGNRLRHQGEVGRDPEALLRPAAPQPETGDDLVEDQDGAMLAAGGECAFQIARRRRDGALVAHRRLHQHGRDIALGEPRFQRREIVPAEDREPRARFRVLALATDHRRRRLLWTCRVQPRRRRPQDVVEPAVIMPLELDDGPLARGSTRQPHRRLRHLRTG